MKQVTGKKRLKPRQKRSQQTVGCIFEATAQRLQTTETRNHVLHGTMRIHACRATDQASICRCEAPMWRRSDPDLCCEPFAAFQRSTRNPQQARPITDQRPRVHWLVYDLYERLLKRLQDELVAFDPNSFAKINNAKRATLVGAVMGSIGMLELNRPDVPETEDHEQVLNLMIEGLLAKDP